MSEREVLEVDVLFVGGGPAGLAGALHLQRLLAQHDALARETGGRRLDAPMVAVVEKAETLGAHTISGAVVDPRALDELLPDWREQTPPLVPVESDELLFLTARRAVALPHPPWMRNTGCWTGSLNSLVRWMGEKAEAAGVNLFAGFPAADLLWDGDAVRGVVTNDKGLDARGQRKANFEVGVEIRAKVTVLCDGSRGHLTKRLVQRCGTEGRNPQVYETGVKETWEVPGAAAHAGRVVHTAGWPLPRNLFGGSFIYWIGRDLITLGLVADLDSEDPTLDLHEEFQRWKTHPFVRALLAGGQRSHYGAKSLPAGGHWSMPRPFVDGCLLAGDALGTLNAARLKGIHLGMKSGMLAAETALAALLAGDSSRRTLSGYETALRDSWAGRELWQFRNFHAAMSHGLGPAAIVQVGLQLLSGGRGLRDPLPTVAGHARMRHLADVRRRRREPFKPDGVLTFDKLTNVYFSGTKHPEDQPNHLLVHADPQHCAVKCREEYGNPCQYFCPAAVYEMVPDARFGADGQALRINFSNCVHCKTCDILDPYQVIEWVTPAQGGPNYQKL